MNFNQLNQWPYILVAFLSLLIIVILLEKRFFKFIQTYWFHKRSLFSFISSLLFLVGMTGLLISLLDPRGPEEKIKTPVPTDRTIILIDTSASMLAEDAKPSRLQKASLMAKHFARKAAGHQISIVAFAEIQKKIVPFTNDLDLIDARLDSLKALRNHYGSSALSAAIQESIQYFREIDENVRGNILVFTDGEETAEGLELKIPKDVNLALVGVGSAQGGRIPLDDANGFRFGYKKDKGRDVITKLNENYFKQIQSQVPASKYWMANSYTLPSEEILEFFNSGKLESLNQQDMVIRPVMMEKIVIPSIVLLILSYLFKSIRIFTLSLFLILGPVRAQEKEIELTPQVLESLDKLQKGELDKLEKLKLADELYKQGSKNEAISLYQENLDPKKIDKSLPPEAYLNYGTSLLESGKANEALSVYDNLSKSLEKNPRGNALKEMMDKNIMAHFIQQEEKKKKEQEQKEKDKKEQKDKKEKGESGQEDEKSSGEKTGKDQQKPDSKEDEKKDKEKSDKDKEKEKSDDKGDEEKDKQKPEDGEPKDQDPKPMPPKKIPAKLKQLMSDDRQLQMKMIENGTRDLNKRNSRKSKDW